MSSVFGEAQIVVVPVAGAAFRTALVKQIEEAKAGLAVTIPVTAVGAEAAAAATGGVTKQTRAAAAATALFEKQELQLAAAEQKALLATTPLGAARARLAGFSNAAATSEAALAKATLSGDEALIAQAEVTAASAAAEEKRATEIVRTIIVENARTAAIGRATTATSGNTAATGANAEALRLQGAAAAQAAAQDAALVTSMEANAAAAAHLIGIEERQALVSGELAKTRAVLASLNKAAADSQAALDAALQTGNAQFIRAQVGVTAYVVSLRELAVANVQAAIAENEEAAVAARSAGAHAQATRGILAETLALFGLRGATLAASAPFLIGASTAIVFTKSIGAASDRIEQLNKSVEVFVSSAPQVEAWAKTTADAFGISETAALASASTFGQLFRTLNVAPAQAAKLSETLVELAADLASFSNASPEDTLRAIQSGLVGQARPLRQYGVFLTEARVKQEALIATGKKNINQLTQQDRILARYNLILRDSAIQQGDVERTQERLANQTRFLKANVQDLTAEIGKLAVPIAIGAVHAIDSLVTGAQTAVEVVKQLKTDLDVLAQVGPIRVTVEIIRKFVGAKIPGGEGSVGDEVKKAAEVAIPAAIALSAATAAPLTGGTSLVAGLAALTALGFAVNNYSDAAKRGQRESDELRRKLQGVGIDATNARNPLTAVSESVEEMFRSLREHPETSSLDAIKLKIASIISLLRTGPPSVQPFADALQKLLLNLNLGKVPGADKLAEQLMKALAAAIPKNTKDITDALVAAGAKAVSDAAVAVAAALGTPQQQLGVLQPRAAQEKSSLARLLGLDPNASTEEILAAAAPEELARRVRIGELSKKRADRVAAVASELSSTNSQIESITNTFASDAKETASRIKDARQKADQAIQDAIAAAVGQTEVRKTIAEGTPQTLDDLNALIHQRAVIRQLIATVVSRIKDEKVRAQAYHQLRLAEIQTTNEIKALRAERTKARVDARAAALEARQAHLQALLSIAETTETKADDRRALEALIAFDQAQIARLKQLRHRTREQNALLDAYRVDLAQRNQTLREITDEAKEGNQAAQAAFEFLQAQQGFAANLLGNLVPLGSLGNTVGGTATPQTQTPVTGVTPHATIQQQAVSKAAQAQGGFTASQSTTVVELLGEMVRELRAIRNGNAHPEARYHKPSTAAAHKPGAHR